MAYRYGKKKPDVVFNYAPYPTLGLFHGSDAEVRGVRGPVGSGKTYACCYEILLQAAKQPPGSDGVRLSRWALIRSTYPELLTTTLKTWESLFGGYTKIRRQPPIEGICNFSLPDGTLIRLELWFLALDLPKDERKLRSLELTGAFINEASEVDRWVLTKAYERTGRFPPKDSGATLGRRLVIMDTNSCDDDHWYYKVSEEEKVEGWQFFDQPPALLRFPTAGSMTRWLKETKKWYPKEYRFKYKRGGDGCYYLPNWLCENIQGQQLGVDYWLGLVSGNTREYINVFLMNEYGPTSDGRPVYSEYVDNLHCAKSDIAPIENVGIALGFDFGLTPACVIGQRLPGGVVVALDELLVTERGAMGIQQFQEDVLIPHLIAHYRPWLERGIVQAYGDPAGSFRVQTNETTCFQALNQKQAIKGDGVISCDAALEALAKKQRVSLGDFGIKSYPAAQSNAFIPRRDAVANLLNARIGESPAVVISPKCRYLRKGLRGSYMFDRVQAAGGRYRDEPLKNHYSHICEAFQYLCLRITSQVFDEVEDDRKKVVASVLASLDSTSRSAWSEAAVLNDDQINSWGDVISPWGGG